MSILKRSKEEELVWAVKELKKEKQRQAVAGMLSAIGKAFPKGVRHPDSLVTNRHLYMPSKRRYKTKLR